MDVSEMMTQLLCSSSCGFTPAQARCLITGERSELSQNAAWDPNCENEEAMLSDNTLIDMGRIFRLASLVEQRLIVSQLPCLKQLYAGLADILPAELCSMFTPSELEVLFCGVPEVDISLLQKVTVYDGVSSTDR
jgi:hypothetical protein